MNYRRCVAKCGSESQIGFVEINLHLNMSVEHVLAFNAWLIGQTLSPTDRQNSNNYDEASGVDDGDDDNGNVVALDSN